ncbi:Transposase [Bacteroidales bacterium Barb6]|nr:Transposase [Bacteroidales bacterium Barb6]
MPLKETIPLENGIPPHDTFNRVFSGLKPDLLRQCLQNYGRDLRCILRFQGLPVGEYLRRPGI